MKHFKPQEFVSYERMNARLLTALDAFREQADTPILITSSFRAGAKGQHGLGNAVDIMFPKKELSDLFDLFLLASRFAEFTGIGIYPHWCLYGADQRGGLHLDVRPAPRALWMGVWEDGKQQYVAMSLANLKKYGVV